MPRPGPILSGIVLILRPVLLERILALFVVVLVVLSAPTPLGHGEPQLVAVGIRQETLPGSIAGERYLGHLDAGIDQLVPGIVQIRRPQVENPALPQGGLQA